MNTTLSFPLQKSTAIPSLAEHAILRYFNFIALYFAQGVPEGMLLFGIPAWMAMNGKTPGEIAAFAVVSGLPWSFKFIVAPLMDRYTYLPMGSKRPWVIFGQIGLVASFILMAFVPDPLNNLNLFMLAAFLVSCFGALQDVATDGMAINVIPADEQAKANGMMWGSKVIGISTSLALGSWILNQYNYKIAIGMLSVMIALIMLVPLFIRERKGEKMLPWTPGEASKENKMNQINNWAEILKSLYRVFSLRNSLLLALMLFIAQGSYNYIGTLLPIFTVKELGWTNVAYAQFYSTSTLVGGIIGMLIGGMLIDKFGKIKMMNIYFTLLILLTAAMVLLKAYWVHTSFIFAFMITYKILYTFGCIGVFSMAMQCCWKKVSASQFTLYMTISNLGRIAMAALIGPIKANFGWEMTIFAFAVMIGVALILLQFLNIDKQVALVSHLEARELRNAELDKNS
jgi:PAT family beta-lactamase induction signal transducer AmpG